MAKWPELTDIPQKHVYAVLRCTEGRYWIDGTSVAMDAETVRQKQQEVRELIPTWDAANPCVLVIKCRLEFLDRA